MVCFVPEWRNSHQSIAFETLHIEGQYTAGNRNFVLFVLSLRKHGTFLFNFQRIHMNQHEC